MGHTKASQLCTQFCAKMTTCVNASQYPYYISVTTDHRSTAVIMVAATTYSATSETLLISRRMARSSTTTTRAITTEYWWHSSAIFKFKIVLGSASVVTFVPLLDIIVADMVEWKWWRDRPRCVTSGAAVGLGSVLFQIYSWAGTKCERWRILSIVIVKIFSILHHRNNFIV